MRLECQGEFTIYILVAKFADGWKAFNLDCIPHDVKKYGPFTACGDCWQKTGINGSFDAEEAFDFLTEVRKFYAFKKKKQEGEFIPKEFKIQKMVITKQLELMDW